MEALDIIKIAANALDDKKGKEITAIKIDDLTVIGEYFLICTANSSTQIRALCDEVEEKLKENDVTPHHIEGRSTGWIVLDYGSVIVHIFGYKEREFYGLDKMWSDGTIVDINKFLKNPQED